MLDNITKRRIDECLKPKAWDLGNKTLYQLCKDNFDHSTTEKIAHYTLFLKRNTLKQEV